MIKRLCLMLGAVAMLCWMAAAFAQAPPAQSLRVGAAKVDITPTQLVKLNPMGGGDFEGIHDPLYARALVLDNGASIAAVVALDLIEVGDTLPLRQRVQRELAIPAEHIFITASHNHSAPKLLSNTPELAAYQRIANDHIVSALQRAKAALQPARMGVGSGSADVNVNRSYFNPARGVWGQGFNPEGPSDKRVWVVKFESLNGEPLAVLFNYAVHALATFDTWMISGDLPGAAEHFVEQRLGGKVVALFTQGSGGDQNPKFAGVTFGGGQGQVQKDRPAIRLRSWPAMEAQGFMLGSEVVRVAGNIQAVVTTPRLAAAQKRIVCPAKPDKRWEAMKDGVPIQLGVLLLDNIAFAAVSGEVVTRINLRLQQASPLSNTILLSLTNGRMGYLIDDASYDRPDFEFNAAPVARGCAESGIVNGVVELMNGLGK